jgi:integrase
VLEGGESAHYGGGRARGPSVEPSLLLAPIALHEARHTCASTFIAAGATPKVIQTVMGHDSIQMTSDVDGHMMRDGLDDAARMVNDYLARAATE